MDQEGLVAGKVEEALGDLFTKAADQRALEEERRRVEKLATSLLAYGVGGDDPVRRALEKVAELRAAEARKTRKAGARGPPGQNDLSPLPDATLSRTGDSDPTIAEAFSGGASPSGQFQDPDNRSRHIVATPPHLQRSEARSDN